MCIASLVGKTYVGNGCITTAASPHGRTSRGSRLQARPARACCFLVISQAGRARAGGAGRADAAGAEQLAPVLARGAVQLLLGRPPDLDAQRLGLQRAALCAGADAAAGSPERDAPADAVDTWGDLAALQGSGVGAADAGYEARQEAEEAAAHALEARARR